MTTYTPTTAHLTTLGMSALNTYRTAERRTVPEAEASKDEDAIIFANTAFVFTCRGCGVTVKCLRRGQADPQKFAETVCHWICRGDDFSCVDLSLQTLSVGRCLCSREEKKRKRQEGTRFKRFASSPRKRRSWRLLGEKVGMERGGRD